MKRLLAAVAASVLLLCPLAHGEVISVNFSGVATDTPADVEEMLSTDTTGVVPVANWNNVDQVADGSDGDASVSNLKNSAGVGTTAGIAFLWDVLGDTETMAPGARASNNPAGQLWEARIDDMVGWAGGTLTITVTGIPYAQYSLYAYYTNDGEVFDITLNGDTGTTKTVKALSVASDDFATYAWQNDTDPSNNALWAGLSGSTLTIDLLNAAYNPDSDSRSVTPVAGFQIVEYLVPEPATLTLLGLGAVAVFVRRKR